MAKHELKIAPTSHVIKWKCPNCGFLHHITVNGGDRLPTELKCNCGFEVSVIDGAWTYTLDCPLDDLKEITAYNIPRTQING